MLQPLFLPIVLFAAGHGNVGSAPPVLFLAATPSNFYECECEVHRRSHAWMAVTTNFTVIGPTEKCVIELAKEAEHLRRQLSEKWLGKTTDNWCPKCQIIVYPTQRKYVAAVGRGSEATVGSSLVDVKNGVISSRQIDLSGESKDYLSSSLPHELTHVVLRDGFVTTRLPRWADEGMATLADTSAKQLRHNNDLRNAVRRNDLLAVAELLDTDGYPRMTKFGVFYGESLSLTSFLVTRGGPQRFVEFVEQAQRIGFDSALRLCYGLQGISDLDRQWRKQLLMNEELIASNGQQ